MNGYIFSKKQTNRLDSAGNDYQILMAAAHIRNSLHNNGVHQNANLSLTIEGLAFDFEKNKTLQCVTWGHVICACDGVIGVLENILRSDQLKQSLPDLIRDEFDLQENG